MPKRRGKGRGTARPAPSEPGLGGILVSLGKWAWLATRMKPLVKAPQGAPSAEGARSSYSAPCRGEGELLMAVGLMVERVRVGVGMVVGGEHGRAGLLVVAG